MVRDLDLDLGSGQGHISIHSTCRTTCRPNDVTVASPSTEICGHLNVVKEEIYVEMYIYGQLSEVQMVCDLDLDIGSDQGHVNIHSTYRTTGMLNHVTEIWPFKFRQISILDEV